MFDKAILCVLSGLVAIGSLIDNPSDTKKVNVRSWLGQDYQQVSKTYAIGQNKIVVKPKTDRITQILLTDDLLSADSIKINDEIAKIYQIYPENWIASDNYNDELKKREVIVLFEKDINFGVANQMVVYRSKDLNYIDEIEVGYTDFDVANMKLPSSNKEAKKLLQGNWISQDGKILKFFGERVEGLASRGIYGDVHYSIVSPNELLLVICKKNEVVDKVSIRFKIDKETLYLFEVDDKGLIIKETLERFSKV